MGSKEPINTNAARMPTWPTTTVGCRNEMWVHNGILFNSAVSSEFGRSAGNHTQEVWFKLRHKQLVRSDVVVYLKDIASRCVLLQKCFLMHFVLSGLLVSG